jgi:hypothetical protein
MAFNLLVYVAVTILVGNLLNVGFLQGMALFLFVCSLGLVSEKARQLLRNPWRRFRYAFGRKKTLVEACRADYKALSERIRSLLINRDLF